MKLTDFNLDVFVIETEDHFGDIIKKLHQRQIELEANPDILKKVIEGKKVNQSKAAAVIELIVDLLEGMTKNYDPSKITEGSMTKEEIALTTISLLKLLVRLNNSVHGVLNNIPFEPQKQFDEAIEEDRYIKIIFDFENENKEKK